VTEQKETFDEELYKRILLMKGELININTEIFITPSDYNIPSVPAGHPLFLVEVYPAPYRPKHTQMSIFQGWIHKDFCNQYDVLHRTRVAKQIMGDQLNWGDNIWLSPTIVVMHPSGTLFTMVNVDLQKINLSTS
jgi:hypothetical protein